MRLMTYRLELDVCRGGNSVSANAKMVPCGWTGGYVPTNVAERLHQALSDLVKLRDIKYTHPELYEKDKDAAWAAAKAALRFAEEDQSR